MFVHYALETKFRKWCFYPNRSVTFPLTHNFIWNFFEFKWNRQIPNLGKLFKKIKKFVTKLLAFFGIKQQIHQIYQD